MEWITEFLNSFSDSAAYFLVMAFRTFTLVCTLITWVAVPGAIFMTLQKLFPATFADKGNSTRPPLLQEVCFAVVVALVILTVDTGIAMAWHPVHAAEGANYGRTIDTSWTGGIP